MKWGWIIGWIVWLVAGHPAAADDDALPLLERGRALVEQGRPADALPFYDQALDMARVQLDPESPAIGRLMHELGLVLRDAADMDRADNEIDRALTVLEQALGPSHIDLVPVLVDLADLRAGTERPAAAESLYQRALPIAEQHLAEQPWMRVIILARLASVIDEQGRLDEAEALYREAIQFGDQGPPAARTSSLSTAQATSLAHLGSLMQRTERMADAEPIYRRALTLREAALGPNHWLVAVSRSDLARLLGHRGETAEALRLARRAADVLAPYCDGLSPVATPDERRSVTSLCRDTHTLVERLERGDLGPVPQPVHIAEPEPAPRPVVVRPSESQHFEFLFVELHIVFQGPSVHLVKVFL